MADYGPCYKSIDWEAGAGRIPHQRHILEPNIVARMVLCGSLARQPKSITRHSRQKGQGWHGEGCGYNRVFGVFDFDKVAITVSHALVQIAETEPTRALQCVGY